MNQSSPDDDRPAGDDRSADDDRLARLRDIDASLDRLRADITPPPADAGDNIDSGQYLAARQELEGQIELLEYERERLRGELGLS
ncbi:hypothetical protein E1264_07735 [Actinomadura sp. KC216]|uniref:hypothetical protein n=1 Tax=Actinomadura sp. KC216 TaxID=2530370 RepID=UPI00104B6C88|nr:hypothetical protein [Actinomadura sp. KC216]TDB89585.1 hypothetical protein E1264_07735 [Actinomadura sp. KC216]